MPTPSRAHGVFAAFAVAALAGSLVPVDAGAQQLGYYRQPAVRGDTVVFVAEGDLWRVGLAGGSATRLTTHAERESKPQLSADGASVAFAAAYEGGTEVWVMPLSGGAPARLTAFGTYSEPCGWTADGKVLVTTRATSGLPDVRMLVIDPVTHAQEPVPLAQAAGGVYGADGALFFTRFPFQGSHTKRYQGGTAQDVWALRPGATEAVSVTPDAPGTDRDPAIDPADPGRLYFVSDRDGTLNVWSMATDGSDLRQHTHRADSGTDDLDVREFAVDQRQLVYRSGADLHRFDLATGADAVIPIALDSDFDQLRERWIDQPMDWASAARLSADGGRVVLTARGQVFTAPTTAGRLVTIATPGVRYRSATPLPDGGVLALGDATGEVELWQLPGDGVGAPVQLTRDATVLRWNPSPSPDGKWIAHTDQDQRLFLLDPKTKINTQIDANDVDRPRDLAWSADSRWLAYTTPAPNGNTVVRLYDTRTKARLDATTAQAPSYSPSFSSDGQWLYVLSDRHLETVVTSPWSPLWSEPFFDAPTVVMGIALTADARSPFAAPDELHPEPVPGEPDDVKETKRKKRKEPPSGVDIAREGLTERIIEAPLGHGNRRGLMVGKDRMFWLQSSADPDAQLDLVVAKFDRDPEGYAPAVLVSGVQDYELSADRKRLLVVKDNAVYVVDATFGPGDALDDAQVDLSSWRLSVVPREEWRQMFDEAWRLERDYFYDPEMHGVDWPAMRARYRPLVDRVTDRAELSDLVAQMVSELSALHTFVSLGDARRGDERDIAPASLAADWVRDEARGGWRITRVWQSDPDRPELRSPLAALGARVSPGEVITSIDGAPTLSVPDPALLLRAKAGQQVLLEVAGAPTSTERKRRGSPPSGARKVVVVPISADEATNRRYHEWEYTRRLAVEAKSGGHIGYVHLRAMGARDMAEWMRAYLPAFDRDGLIVDVRHNNGGNIDSWVLERLMRKAWMYWSQRKGRAPSWNMQYAFRGHVVVLCDASTASDGEAFAEGFRRLGLGKVIGTRTWGGEIWLTGSNLLVDGGVATAAEFGVYGPEGAWLIEGHGVEPDIVVDNLPGATFAGGDAQLEAAIAHLQERIAAEPIPPIQEPAHPDKSKR